MNRSAKNASTAIIAILVLIIGGILYAKIPKKEIAVADKSAINATSTPKGLNLEAYAKGRDTINEIIASQNEGTPKMAVYKPVVPITHAAKEIRISYNTSTTSLKAYGLNVAKTLGPLSGEREDDISLTLSALSSRDQIKVQKLLDNSALYSGLAKNLLKLSVPQKAASIHLALVNNLETSSALAKDMAIILDNPYQALQSADAYRVKKLSLLKSINNVNSLFRDNGITFTATESSRISVN